MTEHELRKLVGEQLPTVSASDLCDDTDRTLLYGYTCDRDTWHVFLRDGAIELVCYRRGGAEYEVIAHVRANVISAQTLVPNKRLYPEACDFEFCQALERAGCFLPFATFNHNRPTTQFYGWVPTPSLALPASAIEGGTEP